jgi:anti-sigma factor RsiW
MSCPLSFEDLSTFVDGECEAARELDLRRHLDQCDRCRDRVAALQRLKLAVGRTTTEEPVPVALARAVRSGGVNVQRHRWRRWASIGGAALAAAAVACVVWWRAAGGSDPFTTALIADHIHYAHNAERLQVAAADPDVLQQWFADRLPFAPEFPALSGAQLLGGRLCTLRGNHLALAFVDKGGEVLSIFVGDAETLTPDASEAWAAATGSRRCREAMNGYRVCYDRHGRLVTAVVGPVDAVPPRHRRARSREELSIPAIRQRIVEKHDGTVWAEGRPGRGATVHHHRRARPPPAAAAAGRGRAMAAGERLNLTGVDAQLTAPTGRGHIRGPGVRSGACGAGTRVAHRRLTPPGGRAATRASRVRTRARSAGTTSVANHGLAASQRLLRGEG